MVCRVWGVTLISVLALMACNILLTVRVLHVREEPLACGGVSSPKAWTAALKEANLTSYLAFLREANIVTDEMYNSKKLPCQSDLKYSSNNSISSNKEINYTNRTKSSGTARDSNTIGPGSNSQSSPAFHVDDQLGRWDNRRLFKTHDHVYTGPSYKELSTKAVVCLATQTSVDRLYWLVQAARHWTEPISVAVFTPAIEYGIAKIYLQYLTTCFPFLGEKITVHFTYPKDHLPVSLTIKIQDLLELCDQPVTVLRQLLKHRGLKMMSWRERLAYPQNVLRNVARKNCDTEWVFLVDVDIVAIPLLSRHLSDFLRGPYAQKCSASVASLHSVAFGKYEASHVSEGQRISNGLVSDY